MLRWAVPIWTLFILVPVARQAILKFGWPRTWPGLLSMFVIFATIAFLSLFPRKPARWFASLKTCSQCGKWDWSDGFYTGFGL